MDLECDPLYVSNPCVWLITMGFADIRCKLKDELCTVPYQLWYGGTKTCAQGKVSTNVCTGVAYQATKKPMTAAIF